MKCPFCKENNDRVIDSREINDGKVIRRRRECLNCKKRFTTYERVEDTPIRVIKRDGRIESFSREKLLNGILKACEKRPVKIEEVENIIDNIISTIHQKGEREIPVTEIGEMVMERLKQLDSVAYVRFASVYRDFKDVEEFLKEINQLMKKGGKK